MATILVVDDYLPSHRLFSYILQQHGHSVITALDGFQALERLGEYAIDLVLTDLAMPKMDGVSLLQQIRADERYTSLPVVMVTASGQERDNLRACSAGVSSFLTKPVDSEELLQTVQQLLPDGSRERVWLPAFPPRPSSA
ncbi:MAG: response regulator [Chloroflexaceae bacterium]|jgi:CheY-like chemotaxis protein|nr:response regulator [Chloroflexaceae bacterium]